MNNMSPIQKLLHHDRDSLAAKRLLEFPIFIIDDNIGSIMNTLKYILILSDADKYNYFNFADRKTEIDFMTQMNIIDNKYAQNVLTPYRFFS